MKVALITGASSGIGRETAIAFQKKGYIVYAAARRIERMKDLQGMGIQTISLDVTLDESMVACINQILSKEGRIDVLVNNAGYGSFGAVESVPMEEARRQIDVNLFGLARMVQLVLPSMREKKYGKIINISSMGGKVWTKYGSWYHATKFAVEGFSDCLRLEVAQFGIDVCVIEPGIIKTDWGQIAADNLVNTTINSAYHKDAKKTADNMMKYYGGNKPTEPVIIAKTIVKAAMKKHPKTRYLVGFLAKPMVFLKWIISDRMFDRVVQRMN